jgi:hypothetical protein
MTKSLRGLSAQRKTPGRRKRTAQRSWGSGLDVPSGNIVIDTGDVVKGVDENRQFTKKTPGRCKHTAQRIRGHVESVILPPESRFVKGRRQTLFIDEAAESDWLRGQKFPNRSPALSPECATAGREDARGLPL